jgi:hypothetical protein
MSDTEHKSDTERKLFPAGRYLARFIAAGLYPSKSGHAMTKITLAVPSVGDASDASDQTLVLYRFGNCLMEWTYIAEQGCGIEIRVDHKVMPMLEAQAQAQGKAPGKALGKAQAQAQARETIHVELMGFAPPHALTLEAIPEGEPVP